MRAGEGLRRSPEPGAGLAYLLGGLGACLLVGGSWWGLFVAPPEQFMGDVQRIMYVHVPTAWVAMLVFVLAAACGIGFLLRNRWVWDHWLEAAIEVGVVMGVLLCLQGSIWAKPTWGVWWDWDPRLTTMAILVFAFAGILALRHFVDEPARRAVWSSVTTIIAAADVPIVYYSVKWWSSLHQVQSSPATVSPAFHWPLRINAFGVTFLVAGLLLLRSKVAALCLRRELAPPPVPVRSSPLEPTAAVLGLGITGVVHGGWSFVWLAYGVSAATAILYSASVLARYRRELRRWRLAVDAGAA